ncbi:uncharacterized protein [Apostichopus japonicus]|uniref:uncharacterized protein isoform X2 n=1 Tax=Stichopus japonicus TaxID=307972 RepID=UPI003AB4E448
MTVEKKPIFIFSHDSSLVFFCLRYKSRYRERMAAYSLRHYKIIHIVSITIYFMIKISPVDSFDITIDSKPGDKVILNCTANEAALKEWKYEGYLIFHNQERFAQEMKNTIYAEEEFRELMNSSVHVDENNSLIINPVSTGHEGTYTCWLDEKKKEKVLLKIKELILQPVEVEVNGTAAMDKIPRKTKAMVTCAANITKLPYHDNLVWRVNSTSDFYSESKFTDTDAHQGSSTRSSVALYSVTYLPQEVREFIECTVTDNTFGTTTTIWRSFQTFDVSLKPIGVQVNGIDITGKVFVARTNDVHVTCTASITGISDYSTFVGRVSTTSNITSNINFTSSNVTLTTKYIFSSTLTGESFSAIYSPSEEKGYIACAVTDTMFGTTTTIRRSFETFDPKPETGSSKNDIYIILAGIFILAVFIFVLWKQNTACQCNNVLR